MKHFFAFTAVLFSVTINAQWDTLNTNSNLKLCGIAFYNEFTGITVGNNPDESGNGTALVTTDRGNTWTLYWFLGFNSGGEYRDVILTPGATAWIVGDSGRFLHKGFPSPTPISEGFISPATLLCGAAPNDSLFFCGGQSGVLYRTMDGGFTWDTLSSGTTENINDIYFADAANGWIVADGGYLAVTADSGTTWNFVFQPLWGFYNFHSIAYQDNMGLNPYIVGAGGNGLFSIDGGVNWYALATGTTQTIRQIRFVNTLSGIMVGDNGYINRTEDGGGNWFGDPSTEGVDFYDIAFGADTTAFICGDSGVVLRSRNDISSVQQHATASLGAKVYPNPSSGPLFAEVLMHSTGNVTIELFDMMGQRLQMNYYENVSEGVNRFDVNTGELAAGTYYIRISNGDAVLTLPYIRN